MASTSRAWRNRIEHAEIFQAFAENTRVTWRRPNLKKKKYWRKFILHFVLNVCVCCELFHLT